MWPSVCPVDLSQDFLACIYCVSSLSRVSFCVIVFCYMFMCVSCFGSFVSTCQVIGYRKTPLMTPSWGVEIMSTKPRWKSMFVFIFLSFGLFMLLCVHCSPPGPTQYIFHTPMARYSLYVLKVPLNTKQTNKPCPHTTDQNKVPVNQYVPVCPALSYEFSPIHSHTHTLIASLYCQQRLIISGIQHRS